MYVLLMLTVLILMAVLSVAVTLVTVVMECLVVVCMITKYYFFLCCFFVFTDIDECFSMPCGNNSVCLNTNGSFECSCLPGFTGDGFSCEG